MHEADLAYGIAQRPGNVFCDASHPRQKSFPVGRVFSVGNQGLAEITSGIVSWGGGLFCRRLQPKEKLDSVEAWEQMAAFCRGH